LGGKVETITVDELIQELQKISNKKLPVFYTDWENDVLIPIGKDDISFMFAAKSRGSDYYQVVPVDTPRTTIPCVVIGYLNET
jgi:hypothetical protein